jgi:hypothetical protein
MQLGPELGWECEVGEHVVLAVVHEFAELRPAGTELVGDVAPCLPCAGLVGLEEGLAQRGVTSVNVVEKAGGFEVATVQAALGGSWRVSLVGGGLSISPMASTPM